MSVLYSKLPTKHRGLDANIVVTASSAFRLCTCAFQFGFAKLYTFLSIKVAFVASNVIFLVSLLLCATAASLPMFIFGRAVTSLGFAGELAGCFAVTVQILPLNQQPVINLPIGTVSLAAMLFLFSDPEATQEHDLTLTQKIRELDLVSNCLFIPSLTALFIALSWAGTKYSWSDRKVIGLFIVFAVLLAAFIFNQYHYGDSAAIPFHIIKNYNVIAGFIFMTCTNSITNILEWALARYYALFMIFASICMPVTAGLMIMYDPHTSLAQIILYSGFAGISGGISFQGSQSAVQILLSTADVNLGISVILFGQSIGPAIFIAIAQVIFMNQLLSSLEDIHGLGDIMNEVTVQQLDTVLGAINRSLTHTWYLTVALACTTIVGSLLVEWRSVKQKQS
ncbi:major facilitator superfamily domain-containing protein [Aspergillus cavernicola]|uniref:Major facilitator superfamily domain-containing protein n=1 Tax=Aspergillus cavernicola TaxID=176166 RepID=A0ABR4J2H9_9EURO